MSLRINQNIDAFNSYRNLSVTQGQMSKSLEKLSSGFRINRAADDAAGLAISEGLRSQAGGLKVAVRNAQDGISVVQTAEGALTEVHSVLQRMRDLAVQAGNDTNNADARTAIAGEATQLQSELTRISGATNFNGTKLLDGSANTLEFQVGAGSSSGDNTISFNFDTADVAAVATALSTGGGNEYAVVTPTAVTGNWTFTTTGVAATSTVAMGAAGSLDTVHQVADKLNGDSGFAASFRATVNQDNELVVNATNGGTLATTAPGTGGAAGAAVAGGISFNTASNARNAIDAIDTQIKAVSTARANLGSVQNRFEHTINNLNVAIENTSAAESRIRDTDMAQEMMQFTRAQILSQAGTAMLAQANSAPQSVLSLLRG
ncbi:flagellin [Nocardioides psychrotolerans]|uniref:Flagellin n=1 Tax=Nocardioides psychrotolerans TaxID=1005945 RepID=A0A1I3Q3D1_9ACTN|nr:flagellin [Nocardioides psychrotolerans]GEP40215.1 flagellin [Nocardioides psychrotolerans]SFJ28358.1 flagellin [Nocardioides psychrotolerans]